MQYILDTVVAALAANPHRKFVYGEVVRARWDERHLHRCRPARRAPLPLPAHDGRALPPPALLQAFFERWWRQQDDETRALVTRLVQDGQVWGGLGLPG